MKLRILLATSFASATISTSALAGDTVLERYVENMARYASAIKHCEGISDPRQQVQNTLRGTLRMDPQLVSRYMVLYERNLREALRGNSKQCRYQAAGHSINVAADALENVLDLKTGAQE